MKSFSRRNFLKTSAGAIGALYLPAFSSTGELQTLSRQLAATWGQTLLRLQVTDRTSKNYGTIIYPAENEVHGRMGDTIYPFLYLADVTKNSAYLDAAILLYDWMERTVSQDDGSWLNEPVKGAWKGTTVFASIALGEAVKNHGDLMPAAFKNKILRRLQKSGDYIYNTFNIDYGNINYPIAATYGLSLLGELLDQPRFKNKGRELAQQALKFITPKDGFLTGEGNPYYTPSAKGCYSVDLGYNVEESLPSLALYGLFTKDETVLQAVTRTMETHMEFMLPDGGWDNSWGTRNYKWTYWGSRTSDGCQPAYALLADRNPAFYQVALKNTQLLAACTKDGILYGGPHYAAHGVTASLHHTFCHLKALTTILDHGIPAVKTTAVLPREKVYGIRAFNDIQTWLVAKGRFRGTVTGYDRNYKDFKGGHASGGALSMLWHEKAGLLLCASMNEYQLYEAGNMQADTTPPTVSLTPRLEYNGYTNINDFSAHISVSETTITVDAKLVNKEQQHPASGEINCQLQYRFLDDRVVITYSHDSAEDISFILPVISPSTDKATIGDKQLHIKRGNTAINIHTDTAITQLPTTNGRIFNFVPGLEAIPLCMKGNHITITIM